MQAKSVRVCNSKKLELTLMIKLFFFFGDIEVGCSQNSSIYTCFDEKKNTSTGIDAWKTNW